MKLSDHLANAFTWDETPQGQDFWDSIHTMLVEIEEKQGKDTPTDDVVSGRPNVTWVDDNGDPSEGELVCVLPKDHAEEDDDELFFVKDEYGYFLWVNNCSLLED